MAQKAFTTALATPGCDIISRPRPWRRENVDEKACTILGSLGTMRCDSWARSSPSSRGSRALTTQIGARPALVPNCSGSLENTDAYRPAEALAN